MNVLFNDYSIDGQFRDTDEFLDSLSHLTLPAMIELEKTGGFLLFKSNAVYEKKICPDINFGGFLSRSYGIPELTRLRRMLQQLLTDPFWENESQTDTHADYICDALGALPGSEPTCFSEAVERNAPLLSLQHEGFSDDTIPVFKNQVLYSIANLFDKESVYAFLLEEGKIGLSAYLLRKKYPIEIKFETNGSQYIADAVEGGEITKDDIKGIAKTFDRHIHYLHDGTSSTLAKSITHKGITYFEFRDKLSQKREFRIFYCWKGNKLCYFNSLIKRTSSTPDMVKDRTIQLIKRHGCT